MTEDLVLRGYQEASREFAGRVSHCGIWQDMGLGKTPTSMMVMLDSLYDRMDVERWLVVGPKLVVSDAWPRQFRRWRQWEPVSWRVLTASDFGMKAEMIDGRRGGLTFGTRQDKAATKKRISEHRELVHLVSWDWLPWLVAAWGRSWPYDGIVLDESTFVGNIDNRRHQAVWHVAQSTAGPGNVSRVIQLTGSPAPNSYETLHGQIRLLDRGDALGDTLGDFRANWMQPDKTRGGQVWSWKLRKGAKDKIDEALQGRVIALRAADYLSLPPVVENAVWLDMGPVARQIYDRLETESVVQLEKGAVVAESAGVLANKLLQCANGAVYHEGGDWSPVHDRKLDALGEILEATTGPVLLAYTYVPEWQRIKQRFKHAKHVKDPGALDAFRKGKTKLLCMHPASGGHGLDGLQEVSSTAVWFGATYNAEHWAQFNARLHRSGQRADRVVVHRLLMTDTIEEAIVKVVERRVDMQDALLQALRLRLYDRERLLT